MKELLRRLRVPTLCLLAAAAPLGAWLKLAIPGMTSGHDPLQIGAFDLVVWPALLLVVLMRLLEDGPKGLIRLVARVPMPAWLLLAIGVWSGLIWPDVAPPTASGDSAGTGGHTPFTAVLKELFQLAEYAMVALVVTAELARDDRARRSALGIMALAFATILVVGAYQYSSDLKYRVTDVASGGETATLSSGRLDGLLPGTRLWIDRANERSPIHIPDDYGARSDEAFALEITSVKDHEAQAKVLDKTRNVVPGDLAVTPRSHFQVGSLLGNRNALGALLAVLIPFAAVLAMGRSGCCCWWNSLWGLLAVGGLMLALSAGALLGAICGTLAGAVLLGRRKLMLAATTLAILLLIVQHLPRHNVTTAINSVSPSREDPRSGERVLALRYVRYDSELTAFGKSLREKPYWFGLGPGGYDREKSLRHSFDERFAVAAETDRPRYYDTLANEPNTFDLWLGQAAQFGLLGLIGFMWLFTWWAGGALWTWKHTAADDASRVLAAGVFAAVVGAAAAGLFTSPWIQGVGPVLVMLVAFVLPEAESHPAPGDPSNPKVVRV